MSKWDWIMAILAGIAVPAYHFGAEGEGGIFATLIIVFVIGGIVKGIQYLVTGKFE